MTTQKLKYFFPVIINPDENDDTNKYTFVRADEGSAKISFFCFSQNDPDGLVIPPFSQFVQNIFKDLRGVLYLTAGTIFFQVLAPEIINFFGGELVKRVLNGYQLVQVTREVVYPIHQK